MARKVRKRSNRGKLFTKRYLKHAQSQKQYWDDYSRNDNTNGIIDKRKIQSSPNGVNEDVELNPPYPWLDISSSLCANDSYITPKLKLVDKCAIILAQNISSVPDTYMDNWRIWRKVWKYVLEFGLDSPKVFAMFYNRFANEPSFCCHKLNNTTENLFLKDPNIYHRLENICSNANVNDLIQYSYANNFDIALTVACPILNELQFLKINLTAIDLSGSNITDSFLSNLIIATREGGLSSLQILVLRHCRNITNSQVLKLMSAPTPLKYIECNHFLIDSDFAARLSHTEIPQFVQNTNWRYISSQNVLVSLPLGMKMYALKNKHNFQYTSNIIFDLFIQPELYQLNGNNETIKSTGWIHRKKRRNADLRAFCYIKDVKTNIKSIPAREKLPSVSKDKLVPRKLKLIKPSVNQFFGL